MQSTNLNMPQSRTDCDKNSYWQKKGTRHLTMFGYLLFLLSAPLSARTTSDSLGASPRTSTNTIPQLWHEIAVPSRAEDSLLNVLVERHRYLPFVKRAILLQTDADLLNREAVSITIGGKSATIQTLLGETNGSKSFIRYGALTEDSKSKEDPTASLGDIFFAVQGGLLASKFYFEDEIYALIPIYKEYHLLLQLNAMRLPNECGTVHQFGATPTESPASTDYRLRVLVAFSQIAMSGLKNYSLTLTPEHFAMMAIGENNLAHWRNPQRIPYLNLEKVAVLSYSELEMKRDLANLTAEKPPFDLLQRWRTEAATDLQILIRSSEDALFGMAKAEADGWSSGRAFCVMTLDGFGFTPYSLAHQIEHLRPDANEPNDNTIAPSVFQSRLSRKELSSLASEENIKKNFIFQSHLAQKELFNSEYEKSEGNAYKTRFFARHSIFYADNRFLNIENIDNQWINSVSDSFVIYEMTKYWDMSPLDGLYHAARNEIFSHKTHEKKSFSTESVPIPTKLPQMVEISESDHAPKEDDDFFFKKSELPDFRIMPNPSHGETFLEYRVSKDGLPIRLDLATLTGQFVARLAENPYHPAGRFTVRWDAGGMPAGVYVCTLRIGDKVQVLRLVVE
jgi:hypothetical protein